MNRQQRRRLVDFATVVLALLAVAIFVAAFAPSLDRRLDSSDGAVELLRRAPAGKGVAEPAWDAPPEPTGRPLWLSIPAIEVQAPIVPLGLREDGTLDTPDDFFDVGWWSGGPLPGATGPSVIVGHVDSPTGAAIFYELQALDPGDEVEVRYNDGSTYRFRVDQLVRVPRDEFPSEAVYGETSGRALRLITCTGAFDRDAGQYEQNLIVFASLVAG